MADEQPGASDPWADDDPPEEWIERIAETEDIPREGVIERLISSYWTLREVQGLLEQATDEAARETDGESADVDPDSSRSDTVRERLDRLEEAIDAEDDELRGELTMLSERVDALEEKFTTRQASLESRFDEEFGHVATILDYLIDVTDGLQDELRTVRTERDVPGERRADREQLRRLKRKAARLGVRTANCGSCDEPVALGPLPTPDCPHCDRRFVDVESATGWFGMGTDELVVEDSPPREDRSAEEATDGVDADPRAGFEWAGERD